MKSIAQLSFIFGKEVSVSWQQVQSVFWRVFHEDVCQPIKYLHGLAQSLIHKHFALRRHIDEREAAADRQVDGRDTAISRVHRSQHVQVLRYREQILSVDLVGQFNLPEVRATDLTGFEQIDSFAQ